MLLHSKQGTVPRACNSLPQKEFHVRLPMILYAMAAVLPFTCKMLWNVGEPGNHSQLSLPAAVADIITVWIEVATTASPIGLVPQERLWWYFGHGEMCVLSAVVGQHFIAVLLLLCLWTMAYP